MKRILILATVALLTGGSLGCQGTNCNWLFRRGAAAEHYPPAICAPVCAPCNPCDPYAGGAGACAPGPETYVPAPGPG